MLQVCVCVCVCGLVLAPAGDTVLLQVCVCVCMCVWPRVGPCRRHCPVAEVCVCVCVCVASCWPLQETLSCCRCVCACVCVCVCQGSTLGAQIIQGGRNSFQNYSGCYKISRVCLCVCACACVCIRVYVHVRV